MARPNINKKRALEYAEKVLKGLDPKPIKYTTLATLAQAEGWGYNGKQKAEAVMYSALKEDIANGNKTFTFHERGFFSLTEHNISRMDLPPSIEIKRMGRRRKQNLMEEIYQQPVFIHQNCGNCHYIKFTHINAISLEGGICMHEESGICNIKSVFPACPLFLQRSDNKIKEDHETSFMLKYALSQIELNKKLNPRKRRTEI